MHSPNDSSHGSSSDSTPNLGHIQRDRFELLSAYLDHEVTADERRQVEAWIAEDATFAAMYRRLLKLQQGFQAMPAPAAAESVDVTIAQVMQRVDRPRPDWRVWTGVGTAMATAAAALVVVSSGLLPVGNTPQIAVKSGDVKSGSPSPGAIEPPAPSGFLVALDEPAFVPTKAAVADEGTPIDRPQETTKKTAQ